MNLKSKNGFTLVEVMVGMGVLIIAMISGLVVLEMVEKNMKATEDSLGYVSARNQLVSLLLDDTSWGQIVSKNAKMSCFLKQNSAVVSDRDCFGQGDPLVLYNIKGDPYVLNGVPAYDFRLPQQGFTSKGQACANYDGNAGTGNPACPYQVVVNWTALCSSSPCVNPPILFTGTTTFNGGPDQMAPNVVNLNFQVIKSRIYCPPKTSPTAHTTGSPDVDVLVPNRVRSTLATNVLTTETGTIDASMDACRRVIVAFSEDLNPAFVPDGNNQSSVYLRDETTGANVFEFRRLGSGTFYDYQLLVNGVTVVNTKPTWLTITRDSVFKFDVTNGLLRFCVDDRCPHYFVQKLDFPFRAVFKPASGMFTPNGFNNISYTLLDL